MHLGRFHNVVWNIENHFTALKLPELLEACAAALDAYASTKTEPALQAFRKKYEETLTAARVVASELLGPYARQIIEQMSLEPYFPPALAQRLEEIVRTRGFDHAGIAADFRNAAAEASKVIANIDRITTAFGELEVEFESVAMDNAAEVGVLLPRAIVGETIPDLTSEFQKLGKLFHAINELTGASDYDPKIRTISSSGWQIFLELGPEQIAAWVIIIERIVNLFATNLEIKSLQKGLSNNEMPPQIIDLIEEEIDRRIAGSLEKLADDVVKEHSKLDDENRKNELTIQLRQGLRHLARRLNQGTQVEINVSIPDEPADPSAPAEGEVVNPDLPAQIAAQRAHIAQLRALQTRAIEASHLTVQVSEEPQPLLKYLAPADDEAT
jgi:hypothetical protein